MTDERNDEQLEDTTHSALRVLTRRTPVTSGWRAADTVRRTVVVRRRRRWTISTAAVLVVAVAAAVSLTTGGSHTAPQAGHPSVANRIDGAVQLVSNAAPITNADASAVDQVVAAEQRLSFALLNQLGAGSNVSVSPASLYLALGMLQNGARGETATQISQALQAAGLSTADQNAGLAGLMSDLDAAAAHDGITLDSANSLWQDRGFNIRTEFLQALAAYYRTGVWQVDYQHDMNGAVQAINDWVSQETHGNITKLFDQLDPSTVLVLANAIYFHAAWQTPFDKGNTTDGTFTTGAGTPAQVKFMSGGHGLQLATGSDYQAVQLPYSGNRFAATVLMPTSGSLADFVHGLSPTTIDSLAFKPADDCQIELPRFTTTAKLDLKSALQALGMSTAFTDSADLSGLSQASTKVDQIIQRVYLGVGEKGTTAAAVTGISIVPTSLPSCSVRFDHPFLFLVRDTQTGAILFASEVQDPSA
ncbi:MAG TPA: serpin family protein [Jatrophihabitans sp.]|jgi:serpin B|nr:serpin family protein [Jatrophihabitans sp.]